MIFKKKISLYVPVVVLMLVVAGLVMYAYVRTAKRKYVADRELLAQQMAVARLSKENDAIRSDIENLQKESFVEKEMRKNLNMKKEDEEVLFIVNGPGSRSASNANSEYQKKDGDSIPAYKKNMNDWLNFVFSLK